MGNIANVVLFDAQPTPVAHTFEPDRTPDGSAIWLDRSATQFIGYNKLTAMLMRPKGPSGEATRNLRAEVKLETPKLEAAAGSDLAGFDPIPKVAYRPTIEIRVTLPERCTEQDRKDLLAYTQDLVNTEMFEELVVKFKVPY